MIVLEFKLKGKAEQYRIIDEMIGTAQFVRNKTLRYWTENQGIKLVDLYKQCAVMAKEFEWAGKLNNPTYKLQTFVLGFLKISFSPSVSRWVFFE